MLACHCSGFEIGALPLVCRKGGCVHGALDCCLEIHHMVPQAGTWMNPYIEKGCALSRMNPYIVKPHHIRFCYGCGCADEDFLNLLMEALL